MRTNVTGVQNITKYTAYGDDLDADDALFNIYADARLALFGDDVFSASTVALQGQLRNRGTLAVSDLTLKDSVVLVNAGELTQTGNVSLGAGDDDAVVVRNLPGALWKIVGSAEIQQAGDNSRFVNLGSFEQTGADDQITVAANFKSFGSIQAEGGIIFQGASTRVFGAITASALTAGDLFLDGADVSVKTIEVTALTMRDKSTLSSSSANLGADIRLVDGAKLVLDGEDQTITWRGALGSGEIDVKGKAEFTTYAGGPELVGNIKFVNSGAVSFGINYLLRNDTSYGGVSTSANVDGAVELDNLAGATWYAGANIAVFNGDGSSRTFFHNWGTFQIGSFYLGQQRGSTTFNMDVVNDGLFTAGPPSTNPNELTNSLNFDNAVTGDGTIEVDANIVTFNVSVAQGQTVAFTGGYLPSPFNNPALVLNDVQEFGAVVSGFEQNGQSNDQIIVNTANWSYQTFVGGEAGGALVFSDGVAETSVHLAGVYDPAKFHAAVSGSRTTITYG